MAGHSQRPKSLRNRLVAIILLEISFPSTYSTSAPNGELASQSQALLNFLNSLGWVQTLRARSGAVQDSVTSVQTHAVLEGLLSFCLSLISRIRKPSVTLQQNGGTKVLLAVPPV